MTMGVTLSSTAAAAFSTISRALGRAAPLHQGAPLPPSVDEAVVRLATSEAHLTVLFLQQAAGAKLHAVSSSREAVAEQVIAILAPTSARSLVLTRSILLEQLGLLERLRDAGYDVRYWDETTLDAAYDVDVGITDVYAAVAETGSIVVKGSAAHGRAVSLVPPVHVAIVERAQILPDLVDLFAKLSAEGTGSGVVIITGPSKTADIEMNLVTGVHGPGEVHVFVVD